jgi:hypothetical protein
MSVYWQCGVGWQNVEGYRFIIPWSPQHHLLETGMRGQAL